MLFHYFLSSVVCYDKYTIIQLTVLPICNISFVLFLRVFLFFDFKYFDDDVYDYNLCSFCLEFPELRESIHL